MGQERLGLGVWRKRGATVGGQGAETAEMPQRGGCASHGQRSGGGKAQEGGVVGVCAEAGFGFLEAASGVSGIEGGPGSSCLECGERERGGAGIVEGAQGVGGALGGEMGQCEVIEALGGGLMEEGVLEVPGGGGWITQLESVTACQVLLSGAGVVHGAGCALEGIGQEGGLSGPSGQVVAESAGAFAGEPQAPGDFGEIGLVGVGALTGGGFELGGGGVEVVDALGEGSGLVGGDCLEAIEVGLQRRGGFGAGAGLMQDPVVDLIEVAGLSVEVGFFLLADGIELRGERSQAFREAADQGIGGCGEAGGFSG